MHFHYLLRYRSPLDVYVPHSVAVIEELRVTTRHSYTELSELLRLAAGVDLNSLIGNDT